MNKKDQATETEAVKLTQYSHGAGCGCKIAPAVLDQILKTSGTLPHFPQLLVGNAERDDAAVYDLGDGTAVVSTTDFFMPIVDDAFDFGRIASVNAISDIYAMGATPLVAIAILGWPVNQIPVSVANQVMEGSRQACLDADIPLAGGHSIDTPEPIFGLAVTGKVQVKDLKKNGGATTNCQLFLSKGLGVGILSTAQKKGKLRPADQLMARDSMIQLNRIGEQLARIPTVKAMTDVTGFGLLGHLSEMAKASDLTAKIHFDQVPLLDQSAMDYYLQEGCIPGGTHRNWKSYGHQIAPISDYQKHILCDPQTSGGLLIAIEKDGVGELQDLFKKKGIPAPESIGHFVESAEYVVEVI